LARPQFRQSAWNNLENKARARSCVGAWQERGKRVLPLIELSDRTMVGAMTQFFKTFFFASCLVALAGCSEDSNSTPATPIDDCEDVDCEDDQSPDDEVTGDLLDGGRSSIDASRPAPRSDGGASDGGARDAGRATDASVGMDAAVADDEDAGPLAAGKVDAGRADAGKVDAGKADAGKADAGTVIEDAGSASEDAGSSEDAGRAVVDAGSTPDTDSGRPDETGTCGGDTPHGCFTPQADNADGCPSAIPEVPTSLFGQRPSCDGSATTLTTVCSYDGPRGGSNSGVANCVCDVGERWLCVYP
jgi:hypothetical protein